MPIIAHNDLPTYDRLKKEGINILSHKDAIHQDIRELHIGLLNMMPDAALMATERQFFYLVSSSNKIAQFYVHPFTLPQIPRNLQTKEHIKKYYDTFDGIKKQGLDALIITGAYVKEKNLKDEIFWKPLIDVINWASKNVTSTLCSCLATHALLQFKYGLKRKPLPKKKWGVYGHYVCKPHPLVRSINTKFEVPHSRFNQVDKEQILEKNLHILVESKKAGVHLATSKDGFKFIFFQGHPEYEKISLLKEYKRECSEYFLNNRKTYPKFLKNYFNRQQKYILKEYKKNLKNAKLKKQKMPEFPEKIIAKCLHNTWHDSAIAVIGNWIGHVYQLTGKNRHEPYMDGVDPSNPLKLDYV
ncbi:MAG: homoserine O-succinyltransferase [Gammaproteobacteria bacterium]|nr:MAG: homoserine O-succinyltransferase [Gammaproteobacteria bacterium]